MNQKPRLLFVSPRFLLPADSGGKIRTTQILRGMKGGAFDITLASPAPEYASTGFERELEAVCDRFAGWPEPVRSRWHRLWRIAGLFGGPPVSVLSDASPDGRKKVAQELERGYDLAVFDFPHSVVLAPPRLDTASLLFTHNVEHEIYGRHSTVAPSPLMRSVWRSQTRKMRAFEKQALGRFDWTVAVSERDARKFKEEFGIANVTVIPTGVDLDFFAFHGPAVSNTVAFTGAMDWAPNVDGMEFLLEEIWPLVTTHIPDASMAVVGRNPPDRLVRRARDLTVRWHFTGFVDDVRPHVRTSAVYVIPLRVGGGTRIKVFEAMAMGCPVVSTAIGVEGLPLQPEEHFLLAESPMEFAEAIVRLLREPALGAAIAARARTFVAAQFSYRTAAQVFEDACVNAMSYHQEARSAAPDRSGFPLSAGS